MLSATVGLLGEKVGIVILGASFVSCIVNETVWLPYSLPCDPISDALITKT